MTDETLDQDAARERVAIEVEHHEPAYAQVIYNRRVAEMEKDDESNNHSREQSTIS
jgi:hypothetical protein